MFKGFYTTDVRLIRLIIGTLLLICQNLVAQCQLGQVKNGFSALIEEVSTLGKTKVPQVKQVRLILSPVNVHWGETYVSAGINLSAYAEINWIPKAGEELKFQWLTKDGLIDASYKDQSITHMFMVPDERQFLRVNLYESSIVNSSTSSPPASLIDSNEIKLIVRNPVIVTNIVGKLFLEHGELLDVKLILNGTGPFYYCHKFCPDFYPESVSSVYDCDKCFAYHGTNEQQLTITHYLHYVGNYTLLFRVNNIINEEIKHYRIKINDTVREQSLPFAPIVSSILAVLILTTGVGLHLHLRKRAYTLETANFDFIRQGQLEEEEEWQEELSFIQRVRYILCRSNCDDDDDDDYVGERRLLATDNKPQYS